MLVGSTLDGVSTAQKLSQGCIEMNPVTRPLYAQSPMRVAIYKGGMTIGFTIAIGKVHKKHPKIADTTSIVLGTMGTVAAIHNWNVKCRN